MLKPDGETMTLIHYNPNSHYSWFLEAFGKQHSFQTFDDKGKNRRLIKQFHGTIEEHLEQLWLLNRAGAGVFFTVNQTDLRGRTTANIQKVRAVFIDLDGAPLPKHFDVTPHLLVNTSPDKYHVYWLVKDMPMESFVLYQQALAAKYDADPKVKDLPRVMRVAGFFHNKKDAYPIKVMQQMGADPYTMAEIRDGLGLKRPETQRIKVDYQPSTYKGKYSGTLRYGVGEGDRHEALVKMLIAIRMRGETFSYAEQEALAFAAACNPPEDKNEVMFQVRDIWKRYAPT